MTKSPLPFRIPQAIWPLLVFGLTLLVLVVLTPQFTAELDPPTGDEPFYLQMSQSLLRDHDFDMTNNYARRDYLEFYPKDTTRPNFRGWESFPWELPPHRSATLRPGLYEKHGIGLAVLVAPAYQAGGRLGAVLLMNFLAALLATNIFLLAREFTGSLKASLAATLGLAFTSPLLAYSFLIFPAVPAALLAVYAFRRARLSPGNNALQLAGMALSLAFLPWLHAGYLLLSLPLFAYFLARNWGSRRVLALVLPPIALSGAAFLYYYYYLYGTIVPNYGDHAGFSFPLGTLRGMLGLFLDQQWGLLTYSPFYLVALAGIFLMARRHRREVPWMLLATVPTFLFFASYRQWWGEWCPPARYLAPILPFAAAPAALALREARRLGKFVSGFLLAASLLLMGSFVAAPKLMYNHPTGESQLFLAYARNWGLDLTRWLPSFVAPGAATGWQAALWVGLAAALVGLLVASSARRRAPAAGPRLSRLSLWHRRLARHPQILTALALGLIVVLGAYFRLVGLDWDSGQHLQPDERFVTMVATDISLPSSLGEYFDSRSSPLNPYNRNHPNYPYGTSFLFLTKLLAGPTGMEGYDRIYLLGRFLSALADLGTVVLVFFMGRRLYGPVVGLLGAFLYSVSVLPIQYSHFFVAEGFTTFFVALTLFLAVRVSQRGGWPNYVGMGTACGLALASKISVALVVPVMMVAAVLAYRGRRDPWPILGLAAALAAAFLAFRVAQPYAFAGAGFLDLRPSLQFLGDIETQRRMAEGSLEFPYTLQWAGTIPYLYPLQNLVWGLGPALAAAALVGTGLALYQLGRGGRLEHLLVLLWVGLAFLYFGGQMVKFMRYLLPIYPFLALLAAYLLVWLLPRRAERSEASQASGASGYREVETLRSAQGDMRERTTAWIPTLKRAYPLVFGLCLATVLVGTLLWALAFTRIYTRPLTRVEASRWVYQNLPPGTVVANEHWDDPLPLALEGRDPGRYQRLTLELYNDDSPAKRDTLVGQLAQADYIFLSSNRLYGSIPRLPLRYPMTIEYYRLLLSGDLGFRRAQTFTSYPNLGPLEMVDDGAEEAFTVYDHPKVIILQKSASFSRERVRQLLSAVPLDDVVRQGPREAAKNALLMPPGLLQANRSGGTWTQLFDPQGLPSRLPFLTWYLLVQALSLAALPLGLAALGGLPDRGYPLLKALGILLVAYFSWLAASLRLAPYTQATILAAAALVALLSALALWLWRGHIREGFRGQWRLILATEVLFLAAFAAFYFIRLANPDLWHAWRGGEKPMDLAYLNAVAKSTYFPPYDPWFSGGYINYYYFGQVLVATLGKLTAIPTTTTYNLAVPLFFALTVLGAFSAGYNLLAMGEGRRRPFLLTLTGGLAAALLVAVAGNLDGLFQLVQGLWQVNPQPFLSPWPGVSGLVNAWLGLGQALGGKSLPVFDYWRSSRLMSPTFSITEFPYFTFLFADLHPHLIALPYTLLALGFALGLAVGSGEGGAARSAQVFLVPLALGALWVINSWDFPTYFLVTAAILLLGQVRRGLAWPALGRWLLMAAGVFVASYLLYYPFHYYYQQFYAGVNPSPEKTPLHQYLAVHGLFIIIIGGYLLSRLREGLRRAPGGWLLLAPGAVLLAGILGALVFAGLPTAAFLAFLLALALLALASGDDQPSRLAALLIAAALVLGLGVEFATIQGDIQRMNTVFKFYLQAWVLMGVASAYCLVVLLREWRRRPWLFYPWALLVAVALWATLLYPLYATPVRVADRFLPLPPTDDGMAFMRAAHYADDRGGVELAWDYRAIRWMQENIPGSPVVLEGVTPLYRWGSRVSIYTGLPTVIGWDWHQKQQRAAYHDLVEKRLSDVRAMYTTTDTGELLRLLRRYQVSYIYVGQLERNYYPASGLAKFEALEGTALRRVYQEGPVSIYQVVGN